MEPWCALSRSTARGHRGDDVALLTMYVEFLLEGSLGLGGPTVPYVFVPGVGKGHAKGGIRYSGDHECRRRTADEGERG